MKTILIIGSGIAGLSCAIETAARGNHAILASPYPSERSQSVMAAGGINAALNSKGENDSPACHAQDTIKGGCYIAGEEAVHDLCESAPEILYWLENIGMIFNRNKDGQINLRSFGGQSHKRTAFSGACTGKQIVAALVNRARSYECSGMIKRCLGLYFYAGLIDDGVCQGALFYNEPAKKMEAIYADSVVMATGGQNLIFGKTTGSMLCDGYAQGKLFEQGALLKNLEFIQYHPTTLETPMKRMLITEGARGEGGRLFYKENDKRIYFMEDKYGERGNLMPRDIISKCIYDAPSQVYLDIAFLGEKHIKERLFETYELCRDYRGMDVTKEPIPVYPSVHFFMGGFSVDENHRTNVESLYAIGECASIYHGANRLGGNSLLAAIYGGRRAAAYIEKEEYHFKRKTLNAFVSDQEKELKNLFSSKSKFPTLYLRQSLAKVMNDNLGITRCAENLEKGLSSIDYYLSVVEKIHFDNSVSIYETYTLPQMLTLSKAIILSALERRETRGAHIREDYPETSGEFRCASIAAWHEGSIKVSFPKGVRV